MNEEWNDCSYTMPEIGEIVETLSDDGYISTLIYTGCTYPRWMVQFGEHIYYMPKYWRKCRPRKVDDSERLLEIINKKDAALAKIAKWFGEFPIVFDGGAQCSYGYLYGSNGERDYMRGVAQEALRLN